MTSNDRIVDGLRRREPDAVRALLDAYGRDIAAASYAVLQSSSEAEDVVMETAMRAWNKAGDLRDSGALRAWLLRIAVNESLSLRRRLLRTVHLDASDVRLVTAGPSATSDSRVLLEQALCKLPPRIRAALFLRYYAAMSINETAAALGRSPNTIRAQLQEGLSKLRKALDEDGPSSLEVDQGSVEVDRG